MTRLDLLRHLIEAATPVRQTIQLLASYPWDSNEELVIITVTHVRHVLDRFLAGEMSANDLENWANAVEGRDDIGFAPERFQAIEGAINALANPILEGEINDIMARDLLRALS